ncbi:MAG: substrate-binding domain-containing protein [Lachnospiraceae bacterium]|nr:substrate-binding domain-containing protein [Lachnospiraceae bacterium]
MKADKIIIILIIFILAVIGGTAAWQLMNMSVSDESYNVTVVVSNSSSPRWANFKEGLSQGAADYGVMLNVVTTADFSGMKQERNIVAKEIENGADALILQLFSSYNQSEYLGSLNLDKPLVLVESDSNPEDVFSSITPDNEAIGSKLAELISVKAKEYSDRKLKVGVLAGNQEELAMYQRLSSFRDSIRGKNIEIAWQISGYTNDDIEMQMKNYQKQNHADCVVALGNDQLEAGIDYYTSYGNQFKNVLYGVGVSEKTVYYLDNGMVASLVVPDEYTCGYLAVKSVYEKLTHAQESKKNIQIDHRIVDRASIFNETDEMMIFPRTQ